MTRLPRHGGELLKKADLPFAAQAWYQAGARLIGGCCRTTPADIAQVYSWVKDLR